MRGARLIPLEISTPRPGVECASPEGDAALSGLIVNLTLPAPPSVNASYVNVAGKGRVRSKLYDDWRGHAGWRLKAQKPRHVAGPVVVMIGIERSNQLADIDNRIKASLDLLVEHQVIKDDRFVIGLTAAWSPGADALMRILIIPAGDISARFQLAEDGKHGGWFLDLPQPTEGDQPHGD